MMNTDAKIFNKMLETDYNSTSKSMSITIKYASFQGCKAGSTYASL